MKIWYRRAIEKLDQLNEHAESWLSDMVDTISRAVARKRGSSA